MTARADRAACWAASSAPAVAVTATTTAGGRTTMTTIDGVGMVAAVGAGMMMTTTISSSPPTLCKDCQQRPVVPYHERCQDGLVRIHPADAVSRAWPPPWLPLRRVRSGLRMDAEHEVVVSTEDWPYPGHGNDRSGC